MLMFALLMAVSTSRASQPVQAWASAGLYGLAYDDLWSGDLLTGGFQLTSPQDPLDWLLFAPQGSVTWRPRRAHRLRLTVNARSLQRYTTVDSELTVVHRLASDGVPLQEAWRERLFLDEASWRLRPGGDPSLDLRLGILPLSAAGGRLLVESWPAARLRLDGARKGWFPATAQGWVAVTPQGTTLATVSLLHEPSMFEHVGVEWSCTRDPHQGIAPLLREDLGMMMDLWRDTSGEFINTWQQQVEAGLYSLYGGQVDGIREFAWDLDTFLALEGQARIHHLTLLASRVLGKVSVDGALIYGFGQASLSGQALPADSAWEDVGVEDWAETAPRTPFQLEMGLRAWAWDAALSSLGDSPWRWTFFFQGMSGDPQLVRHAVDGDPVRLFLASDVDFLRTRMFPADLAARSGALTFPPGVAGHGLMTPGVQLSRDAPRWMGSLELALPMATVPSTLEPNGWIYGLEADLWLAAHLGDRCTPQAEAGLFQPGTFFLGATSGDTFSQVLPLGWRVILGLSWSWEAPR